MKRKSRLTVDMTNDEHMYLKMSCVKLGLSMREFVLKSTSEKIQELEDEWLAEKAKGVLSRIKEGKEGIVFLEDLEKELED